MWTERIRGKHRWPRGVWAVSSCETGVESAGGAVVMSTHSFGRGFGVADRAAILAGGRHVENAVISMRERSASIKGALREQKNAGESIAQAAEHTLGRIREVLGSTERQKTESARLVELISGVRRQSAENTATAGTVSGAIEDLQSEIGALEREISRFRLEDAS